jgi:hypothetical protein
MRVLFTFRFVKAFLYRETLAFVACVSLWTAISSPAADDSEGAASKTRLAPPPIFRDVPTLEKTLAQDNAVVSAELADLARKLGDDSWKVREAAQKKLKELGPSALPALKRIYNESRDIEVQARIEQVFQALVMPLVFPGSVGVSQLGVQLRNDLGIDDEGGLAIGQVLAGSAAERAGLKDGDVIIALNGHGLNRDDGINGFRYRIMAAGKGTAVTLRVKRNGQVRELDVTLDARDEALMSDDDRAGFNSWLADQWRSWFDAHVKAPLPAS